MSYPLGTKIGAPLTNGSPDAKFGTHIDYLGIGGFRTVPTAIERDAIPVKSAVEYDGGGSGQRREGMLVYLQDTKKYYTLKIAGYSTMADATKLVNLTDNRNWVEVPFGASGAGTGSLLPMSYADALAIYTNKGATKFVKGSLYQITKRVLQGTGTTGDVVVAAVSDYELSSSGQFHVAVPDYINGKVWSKTNTVSEVIHLGKTWTLQASGTVTDEPVVGSTSWVIKTGTGIDTNGNSLYEWDEVLYTLSNDWIGERKDKRGNVISMSVAGASDNSFSYPANLDQFPWGHISIFSNYISDSNLRDVFLRGAINPYISNNIIKESSFTGIVGVVDPNDPTNLIGMTLELCNIGYSSLTNVTCNRGNLYSLILNASSFYQCNFSQCSNSVLSNCRINGLGMPLFPCGFLNNNLTGANINSRIAPTQVTSFTGIIATDDLYLVLNENRSNESIGYAAYTAPTFLTLVNAQGSPITTTQMDTSTTASVVIGSDFVWDSAYATGKTVMLEMCSSSSSSLKTLTVSLYTLEGVNVNNSGVSGSTSTPGLTKTGAFTLVTGTTYQVRIATGNTTVTGYLYSARLIIK